MAKNRAKSGKNKKNAGKRTPNKSSNKSTLPLLAAAAVLCLAALALVLAGGGGKKSDQSVGQTEENAAPENAGNSLTDSAENAAGQDADTPQVIEAGENLVIPIDDISSTAQFYSVEVDGTVMEILAVKDSEGNIRTAFNTCQVCYSSGRGYYVQQGNVLVCQNCGNRFTVDQVEIETGGCNPWPIFPENKTVTEDSIEISYDFLKESRDIFANWKATY